MYNSASNKASLDKDSSDSDEEQRESWWIKERAENSPEERQRTVNSRNRKKSVEEGGGDEMSNEVRGFQRKPSFQVMGDFGGLDMEESSGIPNHREFFSVDDEEAAEEIRLLMENQTLSSSHGQEMLQNLKSRRSVHASSNHGDYANSSMGAVRNSKRRRSFHQDSENDEEAEEIRELVKNKTLSDSVGEMRLQEIQSRKVGNRMATIPSSIDKPCDIDRDGLPVNWNRDEPMSHSMFRLILLSRGDPECDRIYCDMEKVGLHVVKVERLQNLDSLEKFKSETRHMSKRKDPGEDLNIRYLYHGTSVNKTCICEEGLDQRLSRMGFFDIDDIFFIKQKYRKGEYIKTLKREPEKENPKPGSWKFYDSVLGCPKDYNEYVIYESRRAMIDYIITFRVNQQGQDRLRERVPSPLFDSQGRETGFVGVKSSGNEDDHFDRLSQEKKQQDKAIWERLQKLHNVDSNTLPSLQEKTARMRHAASEPQFQVEDLEGAFDESAANTTMFPHSQSFSLGDDNDEDVEAVMSALISEFMEVTGSDNSETARYYIDKCQMNIDQAIVCYYDDMP
uniref:Poly [ADP-ribose] polymerase n=1 Tax=Magallana gigas TaxID=29159 RepID=K1R3F2_MAGGI